MTKAGTIIAVIIVLAAKHLAHYLIDYNFKAKHNNK
jgi:hypothetical protein